jgi:hypothetical protein
MEDPAKVNIWGQVKKGFTKEAVNFLQLHRPFLSELGIRKQVNDSIVKGERILVVEGVGWNKAQQIYSFPPQWLFSILLLEEDYLPQDFEPLSKYRKFCSIHVFYFGGCLVCPVCDGSVVY